MWMLNIEGNSMSDYSNIGIIMKLSIRYSQEKEKSGELKG